VIDSFCDSAAGKLGGRKRKLHYQANSC